MAIKFSNLTFTNDEDDIVSPSAVEQILNTEVANTLAAENIIIGTGNDYGFENVNVLSTDDSNDTIIGIENLESELDFSYDIFKSGTLNADEDNDILTGTSRDDNLVNSGTLNVNEDNDILTGNASSNSLRGSGGLFKSTLTIHSIKCLKNGADSFGPDDTYIKINDTKIWGDYNMKRGQTRSVNRSVNRFVHTYQDFSPRVELFDKDAIGPDDQMGAFTAGAFSAINGDTGVAMQEVRGSGSIYEVYYSFTYSSLNRSSAVSVATSGGGNVLMPFEP